ncbi:MAG: BatD family protein [Sumerlaeia bacterium]
MNAPPEFHRARTRRWTLWLAMMLALSLPLAAAAQDPTVRAYIEPDSRITEGDSFAYVIESSQVPSDVEPPTTATGPIALAQSQPMQSSQTSFVNGRMSAVHRLIWNFRTTGTGAFEIPAATIVINGDSYKVDAVQGEVMPIPTIDFGNIGEVKSARTQNTELDRQLEGRIFSVTKAPDEVYLGEPFEVQMYVYRDALIRSGSVTDFRPKGLAQNQPELAQGRYAVPLAEMSYLEPRVRWTEVEIGGETFEHALVHTTTAVAISTGEIEVEGSDMEFALRFRERGAFGWERRIRAELPPQTVTVDVKPLPPAPAQAIAQVVGSYAVTAFADQSHVAEGDLVTLTVRLSGQGYLGRTGLKMPDLAGLQFVAEESEFDLQQSPGGPVVSTKVFELTYQALQPGQVTIPALTVAAFDPEAEQQTLLETDAIELSVERTGDASVAVVSAAPGNRAEARDLAEGRPDIAYIDTDAELSRSDFQRGAGKPLAMRPWFWVVHAAPLLLVFGAMANEERKRREAADPDKLSAKERRSKARAALREASALQSDASQTEDFYRALTTAVTLAVGRATNREPSGLTAESAGQELRRIGADDLAGDTTALLNRCQEMLYAPAAGESSRAKDYETAQKLVDALERWKK